MSFCQYTYARTQQLPELNKRVNTEVAVHRADVLRKRCSQKFRNIQRKTSVLEPVFNKVTGLELSCEYCEIFKNSFFHKTPTVTASEKVISEENISGGGVISIFLINTAE